jgi:hypothetical protein
MLVYKECFSSILFQFLSFVRCIECSWEVANKQGGIYTVLRSKASVRYKKRFTFSPVLQIRIRDPGPGAFLIPGYEKGFFRILDPGSKTHIFES